MKELQWGGIVAVDADQATFTFTVKNTSEQPLILEFLTSQFYDYSVYNSKEERVYNFGKGKLFFQALQFMSLNSGELIQLKSMWNYNTNEAEKVPAGKYTVKAILTIWKINDEIVHSKPSTLLKFYLPPENTPFE